MKNSNRFCLLAVFALITTGSSFAQEMEKSVADFRKIVVSPKINLILNKGDKEFVKIRYAGVDAEKINVKVKGNKLLIYLDEARLVEKQNRVDNDYDNRTVGMYEDAVVTAYVTYRELSKVEIRGDQELTCDSDIDAEKFKLKVYGEVESSFKSITAKTFKASLYGDNRLKVGSGQAGHQVYRLYGDNRIDTRGLSSATTATKIFGDNRIILTASDEIRITAFGEPQISVNGTSHISKGLIIGHANIRMRQ